MHVVTVNIHEAYTDVAIECEVTYNVTGNYRPATLIDPEEFPDVEIVSITYGCLHNMVYDYLSKSDQDIIDEAIAFDREERNAFYEDGHADHLYDMMKEEKMMKGENE